jgi:hypothetical protein
VGLFKRKINKEQQADVREAVRLVSAAMEILLPMKKLIEEAEEDDQKQEQQPENMEESEMEKTENDADEEQEDKKVDQQTGKTKDQGQDVNKDILESLTSMQKSMKEGFSAIQSALLGKSQQPAEVENELTPLEKVLKEHEQLKQNVKENKETLQEIWKGLGIAKSVTPTESKSEDVPPPTRTENSGPPPVGNLDHHGPGKKVRKQYGGLSPLDVAQQVRQPAKRLFNEGGK